MVFIYFSIVILSLSYKETFLVLLFSISFLGFAQSGSVIADREELREIENDFYEQNRKGNTLLKTQLENSLKLDAQNKNEFGCAINNYLLGKVHYSNKRLDSAEYYQKTSKKFAISLNNLPLQVATTRALGGIYYYNQLNDKALKELNTSLKLAETIGDTTAMAKAYNNIGLVYKTMENYTEAIAFLERALNLKIAVGAKKEQISTLTNMGYCYSMLYLFDKSDYFFNKALMLASAQQHNPQISRIWLHMAQNYSREKEAVKAESFFKKSILMSEQIGDSVQWIYSKKYLAEFYVDNHDDFKALATYLEISPQAKTITDGFFLSEYYLGVGNTYKRMGEHKKAESYFNKMLTILPPYNKAAMREGMKILSQACKREGEYKKALMYLERSNEITSELRTAERDRNIEKYKIQYNTAQNEADIEQLIEINEDLEAHKQQNQVLLLTVLTLFFIALVVAVALGIVAKKSRANEDKLQVEIVKNQRKNIELQQANERVKKWSKIKGEFITMVSHEVRTPLNAIIGMTQFLRDTKLSQSQINKLNNIDISSHNLLTLMNDILDFSSLQENKLSINVQPSNFGNLISNLTDIFGPQYEEKGVEFQTIIDNNLPESIYTDEHRIKQVLANLLSNALKFTHYGKVQFMVEQIGKHHENGHDYVELKFTVSDTGIGVPEEKQDILFKSFTQTDSTSTREYRGVGLGLSICAGILEEFDTKIRFHSEFGKGSTFWFPIKLRVNNPLKSVQVLDITEEPLSMAAIHPMKILVAEDNAINRSLMKLSLSKLGYNPILVENGQEAVDACKNGSFDVILMDIQMPILDGIAATKQIRLIPNIGRPTIIAVTANAIGHEKEKYIKSGMDDYLAKPYTIQQLTNMLKKHGPTVMA